MMQAQNNFAVGAQSMTGTNNDSDITARQHYDDYSTTNQEKKLVGPPPNVGTAAERVQLTQIENAIDCLLAQ